MRAAGAALVAAAVFFAGVLVGSGGQSAGAPIPRPVVVVAAVGADDPGGRSEARAPAPDELDVETVERPVQEGSVEDYGDHGNVGEGGSDSSGPGSGEPTPSTEDPDPTESPTDNSGPGSASSGSGSDNSGPGSSSSGSGSGGSGSG